MNAMSDSSAIPVRRAEDVSKAKERSKPVAADPPSLAAVSPVGPRKLIRPQLPVGVTASRYPTRLAAILPVTSNHLARKVSGATKADSHAEAFYFQKQIQSQTLMMFVLDDGEQIEGHIEWYDRDAIKVRHGGLRTLIYKAGIKYLYKASDKPHS
jgi:sRNA-binding regulator protein Hfq